MNLVLFEDSGAERLFPITTGRPCYAITCGSYKLVDWVTSFGFPIVSVVRDYLRAIQSCDYPVFKNELDTQLEWTLVVNSRLAPTVANIESLRKLMKKVAESTEREGVVVRCGWAVGAAMIPTRQLTEKVGEGLLGALEDYCNGALEPVRMEELPLTLLDYPHDAVRENLNSFQDNLAHRLSSGNYQEIFQDVYCKGEVAISDHVVFDTSSGPVVIEEGVSIGPFTLIEGPVFIDRKCRIIEHAAIKDCVSLGHTTKIGGEVEASVIESYTNKQHHGFLGHCYLGSWINLGAGTCNSDLKNTYGKVNMEYGGKRVATDMRFIGSIIGDFAKTAINTSIFTGKTIGACSMVYGFVTTNVPSFVNYARSFGQTTELPPSVMQSTQQRMFARRNVLQRECDIQLLVDMHRVTSDERQISGDPLVL